MARLKKSKDELSLAHYKILITISELNDKEFYPTAKGVFNILTGKEDNETILFTYLRTYGTLLSIPSRRVCAYIKYLVKLDYLKEIYNKENDDLYLKITPVGDSIAQLYLHNNKKGFNKVNKKPKKEIIHL